MDYQTEILAEVPAFLTALESNHDASQAKSDDDMMSRQVMFYTRDTRYCAFVMFQDLKGLSHEMDLAFDYMYDQLQA